MTNLNFRRKGDVYSTYFPFPSYMVYSFCYFNFDLKFGFLDISILDFEKAERIVKDRESYQLTMF